MQHQEDVPAVDDGVVEGVLQALEALGEDLEARASGRRRRGSGTREVVFEPDAIIRNRSLRLRPMPTQNRASVSWWTSSSASWAVPEPVAPDLVGAPGLVDGRVVEVRALAVPGRAAHRADDLVVEHLAVAQVLDPDRVALVADHVGGPGEQVPVGADRGAAEGEELVALGQRVEVEQQLLAGQRGLVGRAVLGRLRRASSRPGPRTGTRQLAPYSLPSKERP